MRDTIAVEVPGGVPAGRDRRTDAVLRALTGADEEAVAAATHVTTTARADLLLERCVVSLGGRPAGRASIAALTVGDRDALLWHIRRHAFGERVDAVVSCDACQDKLDLAVGVGDLLQPRYADWSLERTEPLAGHDVRFRLPTSADLAAIADTARSDPEAAAVDLLRRCVTAVDGDAPTDDQLTTVRADVERRVAALDPQAETLLTTACPSCGAELSTALDAAAFVLEEVTRHGRHLIEEVHTFAWYYHWSETDILALPVGRRRRYLELIADAVGGGQP